MRTIQQKRLELPKSLIQARKRFNLWRQTHPPRSRFSENLWSDAVAVARECGPTRTARVLGLDYSSLKKRLTFTSSANGRNNKTTSSFLELIPSTKAECVIEMEDNEGSKMRISYKGGDMPDLISLSRNFWRVEA